MAPGLFLMILKFPWEEAFEIIDLWKADVHTREFPKKQAAKICLLFITPKPNPIPLINLLNVQMKTILVFAMLLSFAACKNTSNYSGIVYAGKSYFHLSYDNLWLVADKFSSSVTHAIDSPVIGQRYRFIRKGGRTVFNTMYFITTPQGLQYYFQIAPGLKLWINTESMVTLSCEDGKLSTPRMAWGECCIEASDSLDFSLSDSLTVSLNKGTCLNIKRNIEQSLINVSLVRGRARFAGSYGKFIGSAVLQEPGKQIVINEENPVAQFKNIDTGKVVAWRNAGDLLAGDSNLNEILDKVGNWYHQTIVVIDKIKNPVTSSAHLSIPCSTPLDTVLKKIETSFDISVRSHGESILVYETSPFYGGFCY